jgi:2-isopropylmalate synthase
MPSPQLGGDGLQLGGNQVEDAFVRMKALADRKTRSATMKLDVAGQMKIEEAEGNGPVDAVFNCIKALVPHEAKLELYQVHAVTEGTDAQAEVSVRLAHEGRSMTAKGADPDTLVASAKAYLGAFNKIVMKHQRDMPAQAAS